MGISDQQIAGQQKGYANDKRRAEKELGKQPHTYKHSFLRKAQNNMGFSPPVYASLGLVTPLQACCLRLSRPVVYASLGLLFTPL